MLTPYEPSAKTTATPSQQTQQPQLRSIQQPHPSQTSTSASTERIPTYAESNAAPPSSTPQSAPATLPLALPTDLPPAYTPLDTNQTTFSINGPFISTPAGPAYHLSSPLYTRGSPLRLRRLTPREVGILTQPQSQAHAYSSNQITNLSHASHGHTNTMSIAHPGADTATRPGTHTVPVPGSNIISFQKPDTLYELFAPAFLAHDIQVRGKRASCLPGVLEVKCKTDLKIHGTAFGSLDSCKAKVIQTQPGASSAGREIMSSKRKRVERGTQGFGYGSEWRDGAGRVLATDYLRAGALEEGGGVVPVIELSRELDQTWREAVLSVWVARLWWAFSREKSAVFGGLGRSDAIWV